MVSSSKIKVKGCSDKTTKVMHEDPSSIFVAIDPETIWMTSPLGWERPITASVKG